MNNTITSAPTDSVIETEVQILLNHVSPSYESDVRRRGLINYIQGLFNVYCHDYKLALGGSFPLQVYLPDSDMDVTMLTPESENDELSIVMEIFSCLCQAIKDNERNNNLPFVVDDAEFKIQSIEFINARIKVVKCVINRMSLDITANQRNSLASATFLEEANRLIGNRSILKKGIILVKVWCLQESAKYNTLNLSISGSKEGMFSSYALSILVLYLFNLFPVQMTSPLHVLRLFLETFSTFQFDKYVLTLDGPIPIQNGGGHAAPHGEEKAIENRFRKVAEKVYNTLSSKDKSAASVYMTDYTSKFRLRTCNIVDPVDPINNLGVSVTWRNFRCIKDSLSKGLLHLNESLLYMESSLVKKSTSTLGGEPSPAPSPSPSQVGGHTPPPPSHRKSLINMDALSGAVNGIAPGLKFPNMNSAASACLSPPAPSNCAPLLEPEISPPLAILNGHINPPMMSIAPSISMASSPAINGIASSASGARCQSGYSVVVPVLPTNTMALAKEFRFLKRFFPSCVTCYQIENMYGSTIYSGQPDLASVGNNSTSLRSTSPFRDISPVIPSSRVDRSNSVSCSSQHQHQIQHQFQSRGVPPSRGTSDTSGGYSGQPVSFLGAATTPFRMRSQSYTSSLSSGVASEGSFLTSAEKDSSTPLQGDLTAMWEALNYEVKESKRLTKAPPTSSRGHVGASDSLSDSSNALSFLDDKEVTAVDHVSSISLAEEMMRQEQEVHQSMSVAASQFLTHPQMPPLAKKMTPLIAPSEQQLKSASLVESPLNRKIVSENNIQALGGGQSSNAIIPQSGSLSLNNGSKSKRKKGKSKETLIETSDGGGGGGRKQKNQDGSQTSVTDAAGHNNEVIERAAPIEHNDNADQELDNDGHFMKNINLYQYLAGALLVSAAVLVIMYGCGWLTPATKPSAEMRSAYMKAHQNLAYQGRTGSSGSGTSSPGGSTTDGNIMGSGFGKKAHSSLGVTNPLEGDVSVGRGEEGNEIDDDDERNMSAMYDAFMKAESNYSAGDVIPNEGGVLASRPSALLGDLNDLVNVAELWLVKGQNVTLGLSTKAQGSYHRYINGMSKRLLSAPGDDAAAATKHEGMWFKESTPLLHSNSSIYLKVTNMNVNTTGVYTFAIVKQKIRKGFSARPSGKVMSVDSAGRVSSAPSHHSVASVNGEVMYREGVSIIDSKLDPSFEVIRVLSRTVLRLGAAPSSPTRDMFLVLSVGSQLILHIDDQGSPQPALQWYKNGVALRKERKNVLTVHDVNKSHEGTYTCVLTNMAGKFVWQEATVIIND